MLASRQGMVRYLCLNTFDMLDFVTKIKKVNNGIQN